MSFWNRTMDWLGLGDDVYDDYDLDEYDEPAPRGRRGVESEPRRRDDTGHGNEGVVRTMPNRPTFPSRDFDPSPSRRAADESGVQPRPQRSRHNGGGGAGGGGDRAGAMTVHSGEPAAVSPRRFDQAQELADKFKEGQPVIMNLEGAEREVARRLIDFASGICYALDGSMEKVANGVYLLKPPSSPNRSYGNDDEYDDYSDYDYR